jgi:hypothetical protein
MGERVRAGLVREIRALREDALGRERTATRLQLFLATSI